MLKIKELRKKNNITLQKLADYLHTATSTISQYENGKREASFDTLCKLAEFFNVSVDYLLGREEKSMQEEPIIEENKVIIYARGGGKKEITLTDKQRKAFEALADSIDDKAP